MKQISLATTVFELVTKRTRKVFCGLAMRFIIILLSLLIFVLQLQGCEKEAAKNAREARDQHKKSEAIFANAVHNYYLPILKKRQSECKDPNLVECRILPAFYDAKIEMLVVGNVSYFKLETDVCTHFGGAENIRKIYDVYATCPNETKN